MLPHEKVLASVSACLAAQVRALRSGAHLDDARLARRAGLPLSRVRRIESGHAGPVTISDLAALSKALRCEPTDLLREVRPARPR